MKVYLETYGCAANKNDSEIIIALLLENGFEIVNEIEKADLLIINTCAVKQATISKMCSRIQHLSSFKKPLIIAGCLPKVRKDLIKKFAPNASLICSQAIDKIVEAANRTLNNEKVEILEGNANKTALPSIRFNPVIEIVQIAEGCLSNCTYCATKIAKGNIRSFRIGDIKRKIENAVKNNAKEIWLTSQDNSAYGKDIGTNLVELLEEIIKIEGKFWIRVGMMNPLHLKKLEVEKLAEIFKNEKLFKFIHLPVQSGSNRVLEHMKRGYSVEEFLDWISIFEKTVKNITIATDIIVGYPTESEKDFELTLELIKKLKPDVVNISKFSPIKGTEAANLRKLNSKIVDERSKMLSELVRKISLEKNKKWIGWKGEALIDEKVKNGFIARNIYYKPIFVKNGNFGNFVNVEIKYAYPNFLSTVKI